MSPFCLICIEERHSQCYDSQRGAPSRDNSHYTESGAGLRPFQADEVTFRGTAQITDDTTSAEETLFQSMEEGGGDCVLFPTTRTEQIGQ